MKMFADNRVTFFLILQLIGIYCWYYVIYMAMNLFYWVLCHALHVYILKTTAIAVF
jgi:hypothetical protein